MLTVLLLLGAPLMWWSRHAFPEWKLPPTSSVEKRIKIVHGVGFFVTFAACVVLAYALLSYTRRMEPSLGMLLLLVAPVTAAFTWLGYRRRLRFFRFLWRLMLFCNIMLSRVTWWTRPSIPSSSCFFSA